MTEAEIRQAFEEWDSTERLMRFGSVHYWRRSDDQDAYEAPYTQERWQVWTAAIAVRDQEVEALRAEIDRLKT